MVDFNIYSPFSIGFDETFNRLEALAGAGTNYPPYNVVNGRDGRTTLEIIQSNSLLLNAQISLADSERNFILSQFNLLKSIGLLNSDYLKLR